MRLERFDRRIAQTVKLQKPNNMMNGLFAQHMSGRLAWRLDVHESNHSPHQNPPHTHTTLRFFLSFMTHPWNRLQILNNTSAPTPHRVRGWAGGGGGVLNLKLRAIFPN